MKYNKTYIPPAPIAKIKLRNPITKESISDIPMLLDTGADVTLIPQIYCEKIGVNISRRNSLELEGFNKTKSFAHFTKLDFIFLNKLFRGNFLIYENDEGIIGRDILNNFSILLDGKNLSWDETP